MLSHALYQNQAHTQLCLTSALIPVKPTLGFTLNIIDEYIPLTDRVVLTGNVRANG
jgi:hypothetical protein